MIDDSQLRQLAADLDAAPRKVDALKLVTVEALKTKKDWAARWTGIRGMPHLARSVTYDVEQTASGAEAEIGPDPSRTQGPLDNIVEFGSSINGPIRPVTKAVADAAADRLEDFLGIAGRDAL